jgi:hypothetical protein
MLAQTIDQISELSKIQPIKTLRGKKTFLNVTPPSSDKYFFNSENVGGAC